MTGQPRVFLVDDHELILSGIRSELAGSVDLVGEADEVDVAIEMILERTPDVVLLDVHMPGGGGLAVLNAVNAKCPAIRFLATRSTASRRATPSSHLDWPGSSWTRSLSRE